MSKGSRPVYSVGIDDVDKESWNHIIEQFEDANIYQTWSWGIARKYGNDNISHIIVRRDKEVVAAVQACIVKTPVINTGIAHVRWGPLWKRRGVDSDVEDIREILAAMHRTYVDDRGLFLRIIPRDRKQLQDDLRPIFEDVGFRWRQDEVRTLYVPLTEPLEQIRNNLSKEWKKNLIRGEKKGLEIVEGKDTGLFKDVVRLFEEMRERKQFVSGRTTMADYSLLQEDLPDYLKMRIMICQFEGKPVAGIVVSAIGDIGIELIAATGSDGLKLGASYLLRWRTVDYLKKRGCNFYDLNGITTRNPGVAHFKRGLGGRNGLDIERIGIFEACNNPLSKLAVTSGEAIRKAYKNGLRPIKFKLLDLWHSPRNRLNQ